MATKVETKIVLPTERSEVDIRWISQKTGMIGAGGIGKSEFWSHGENTLYIQTEAGLNHLKVMKLVCQTWDDFRNIYTALIQAHQESKFPYDTIVLDTIDEFIDLVNQEVIARGHAKFKNIASEINTIGDIPNGAGWQWATELIRLAFGKLEVLPAHIVYIGHLESKEVKTPTDKYHKQTISIGGKTGLNLVAWCDHFMNVEAQMHGQKLVRVVRTLPQATVEAKSRGGVVPHLWKWEDDSKVNYAKFRALFN